MQLKEFQQVPYVVLRTAHYGRTAETDERGGYPLFVGSAEIWVQVWKFLSENRKLLKAIEVAAIM